MKMLLKQQHCTAQESIGSKTEKRTLSKSCSCCSGEDGKKDLDWGGDARELPLTLTLHVFKSTILRQEPPAGNTGQLRVLGLAVLLEFSSALFGACLTYKAQLLVSGHMFRADVHLLPSKSGKGRARAVLPPVVLPDPARA